MTDDLLKPLKEFCEEYDGLNCIDQLKSMLLPLEKQLATRDAELADLRRQLAEADSTIKDYRQQLDVWEANESCPECGEKHVCGVQSTLVDLRTDSAAYVQERVEAELKIACQLICEGCAENVESRLYSDSKHQHEHVLYLKDCKALPIRQRLAAHRSKLAEAQPKGDAK